MSLRHDSDTESQMYVESSNDDEDDDDIQKIEPPDKKEMHDEKEDEDVQDITSWWMARKQHSDEKEEESKAEEADAEDEEEEEEEEEEEDCPSPPRVKRKRSVKRHRLFNEGDTSDEEEQEGKHFRRRTLDAKSTSKEALRLFLCAQPTLAILAPWFSYLFETLGCSSFSMDKPGHLLMMLQTQRPQLTRITQPVKQACLLCGQRPRICAYSLSFSSSKSSSSSLFPWFHLQRHLDPTKPYTQHFSLFLTMELKTLSASIFETPGQAHIDAECYELLERYYTVLERLQVDRLKIQEIALRQYNPTMQHLQLELVVENAWTFWSGFLCKHTFLD